MNEMNKQTEQSKVASVSSAGVARRKMILASLGKGSAVAAAVAAPMQSLAAIGTLSVTADGKRCTISGTMSGVHSNETVIPICAGGSPTYYKTTSNWPSSTTLTPNTPFNSVFGSGSSAAMIDILNGTAGTTAEASWIAALLNGTPGSYGDANNFPYTAAQVVGFYVAGGPTAAQALTFFQTYMQTKIL